MVLPWDAEGIGLLLHMHSVTIGTVWVLACCFSTHGFASKNTVGIGLLLHMHGVAIGTQWALACCFTCMVLP